jgi:hypothetical protein
VSCRPCSMALRVASRFVRSCRVMPLAHMERPTSVSTCSGESDRSDGLRRRSESEGFGVFIEAMSSAKKSIHPAAAVRGSVVRAEQETWFRLPSLSTCGSPLLDEPSAWGALRPRGLRPDHDATPTVKGSVARHLAMSGHLTRLPDARLAGNQRWGAPAHILLPHQLRLRLLRGAP